MTRALQEHLKKWAGCPILMRRFYKTFKESAGTSLRSSYFVLKGGRGPEWAFSIGLFHSFGHPEVILFGLPLERCMTLVNVIGRQAKAGTRYQSGKEYADILQNPYKCVFRDVRRDHYRDYVGYASWFYETDSFPLMQCFWPDKDRSIPVGRWLQRFRHRVLVYWWLQPQERTRRFAAATFADRTLHGAHLLSERFQLRRNEKTSARKRW